MKELNVWTADRLSGLLSQEGNCIFNYAHDTPDTHAVSLTMPVRLQSYVHRRLHPVFQMNLPEGALLASIKNAIAKIAGTDDLTLLHIVGSSLIGRNRFAAVGETSPSPDHKVESLSEILKYPDTQELFRDLLEKYALKSGVSGIQPKVLLDASERATIYASSYIVKYSGEDYPLLSANEYFCMSAAKIAGLSVPEFHLSEDGKLFIMKRFDREEAGNSLGFEDFCSLQGLNTEEKYNGSYERMAKTIRDNVSSEFQLSAREQFFKTIVLSTILRNGDAHLKNFGVLYRDPASAKWLAPVYDVVTTVAYLRKDVPALTIGGTKKWWGRRTLSKFGVAVCGISTSRLERAIEQVSDAVTTVRKKIARYSGKIPEFREVGQRMIQAWDQGLLLNEE